MLDTLKSMGYLAVKELWYAVDRRLQLLYDDNGSINMVNVAKRTREVHLFVVHIVSKAVVVDDDIDNNLEYVIVEVNVELGHGGLSEVVLGDEGLGGEGRGLNEGDLGGRGENEDDLGGEAEADLGGVGEDEARNGGEADLGGAVGEDEFGGGGEADLGGPAGEDEFEGGGEADLGGPAGEDEFGGGDGVFETEVDIEAEVYNWDESETEDEEFVDIPVNVMGDNNNSNNDVGSVAVEVGISEEENQSDSEHKGKVLKDIDRGLSNDQWLSDELLSGAESDCEIEDDDNSGDVFGMFVMPKSITDYKWEVGTYFLDKEHFRDVVRTYAIHSGRNIRFVKNDKRRIRVRCLGAQGNCPWLAYYALLTSHHKWKLRKVVNVHTCSREFTIDIINSKWLSGTLETHLRENPSIKINEIRNKAFRKWNTRVSMSIARRARATTADQVQGSFKEQFRRIYDYANDLLKSNPGSTIKLKVEDVQGQATFKRFYTCLIACKDSFVSCRPIIGLDGCFLKGRYGVELLMTVGRDGNDQMLPLCYALVEVENKETWTWFMELLIEDLGGPEVCQSITFMSNQQKVNSITDLINILNCLKYAYGLIYFTFCF